MSELVYILQPAGYVDLKALDVNAACKTPPKASQREAPCKALHLRSPSHPQQKETWDISFRRSTCEKGCQDWKDKGHCDVTCWPTIAKAEKARPKWRIRCQLSRRIPSWYSTTQPWPNASESVCSHVFLATKTQEHAQCTSPHRVIMITMYSLHFTT